MRERTGAKSRSPHNIQEPHSRNQPKVVFAFPLVAKPRGRYFWDLLEALADLFPNVAVIIGAFGAFRDSYIPDTLRCKIHVIRGSKYIRLPLKSGGEYEFGIQVPPVGRFLRELAKVKPDIIFTNAFSLWTFAVVLLKPLMKWKVVVMYEGSSPSVDRNQNTFILTYRRVIASKIDAAITNTEAGRRYLCGWLRLPTEKVFAHPYEVPRPNIGGAESHDGSAHSVVFATVGQIIRRKGIQVLIEAAHMLSQKTDKRSFQVWIIGDGPMREDLELKVKGLQLEDRVLFCGWIDNEQLWQRLEKIDVFVFPTLEDVWGVAPLEAMALGKPVLCSRYAGAAELVSEGVEGWTFDPYEPSELARLMERFLDDPGLIWKMGQNAQIKMRNYTPESAAKFLKDVTDRLAGSAVE